MMEDQVHAKDWRAHFSSLRPKLLRKASAPDPSMVSNHPAPALPRLTTLGLPQTPPMVSKEGAILGLPLPPRLRNNVPSSIYSARAPRTASPASSSSRRSSSGSMGSTPASSVTSASDYIGHSPNNPWLEDDGTHVTTGWLPPKPDYSHPQRARRPETPPEPRQASFLRTPSPKQAPRPPFGNASPSIYANSPPSSMPPSPPPTLPQSRFGAPPLEPLRKTKPSPPTAHNSHMNRPVPHTVPKPMKPSPLQISDRASTMRGLRSAPPPGDMPSPPPRSAARTSPDSQITPGLPTSRYNPAAPLPLFTPKHTPKGSDSSMTSPSSPYPPHVPMLPLTPPIMDPEDVPISRAEIGSLWGHASLLYHNRRTSDALNTFSDLQKRRGIPQETLARLTLNVGIISTQLARRATALASPTMGTNSPSAQNYHIATEAFHSAINSHPGGCIGVAGTFLLGCALFDAGQHAKAADCFDMCEGVFVSEGWAAEESHRFTPVDEEADLRNIGLDFTLRLRDVRANWRVCQERVRIPMGLGTNRHLERIPETLLLEAMECNIPLPIAQSDDPACHEEGELVYMAFDTSTLSSSPTALHQAAYGPPTAQTPKKHAYTHSNTLPHATRPESPYVPPLNTSHAHATSLPTSPTATNSKHSHHNDNANPTTAPTSQSTQNPNLTSNIAPGFKLPTITPALMADATRREALSDSERERQRKKEARETRMLIRLGDLRLNKPLPPLPYVPLGYSRPGQAGGERGPRTAGPGMEASGVGGGMWM